MDNAELKFLAHVKAHLKQFDGKPNTAEKALGLPTDALRSLFKGTRKAGTSLNRVEEICNAMGLELYIGPPRQPSDAPAVDPDHDPDYALVPTYPVAASAGPGASAVDAAPDGALAFRKDWLTRRGISLANAALLRARGDSMMPVIWDGDLLMIDRARTNPAASTSRTYGKPVYVVEHDGQLLVKVLRRIDDTRLHLVSENADAYPAIELRGEEINALRIIGRVVWWGHSAE